MTDCLTDDGFYQVTDCLTDDRFYQVIDCLTDDGFNQVTDCLTDNLFYQVTDFCTDCLPFSRLRYLSVSSLFRDEFDYNNWMYGLAGRVAEVIGGASWEELLRTRLFRPLGMSDSRVLGQTVTVEAGNFARPYIQTGSDVVPSDPAIYRWS